MYSSRIKSSCERHQGYTFKESPAPILMFKGKRKSFQAFHKFRREEVSNLGVRSAAPSWKQLGFMYLVLLFELEGLFNFLFLQGSEEKGEGAIGSPGAKANAGASVRGPLPAARWGGDPLAPGTPQARALPPADTRPGGPAATELGRDHSGSTQVRACERGPGTTVPWLCLSFGRRQQEEQNGHFPKTRRGPATGGGILNLVPGGRRPHGLGQSARGASIAGKYRPSQTGPPRNLSPKP